ncbi:hypothetical protein PANA5342_pPANA10213 (plasmid) [Pantoea ananatis LMG 5342]|nr:hypothetical protein PANA5342_pPANA10213 [Pantoea ananatis LMG 5342]
MRQYDLVSQMCGVKNYASPDTFANNWEHLLKMVDRV